jgi:hypothetical protein
MSFVMLIFCWLESAFCGAYIMLLMFICECLTSFFVMLSSFKHFKLLVGSSTTVNYKMVLSLVCSYHAYAHADFMFIVF